MLKPIARHVQCVELHIAIKNGAQYVYLVLLLTEQYIVEYTISSKIFREFIALIQIFFYV